jgi:membrane protein
LWFGGLVGLWTVGSFVETIRDIFRRAYGVRSSKPFWHYRLSSMAIIILSVILALAAFLVQGLLTGVEQFVYRNLPVAEDLAGWIGVSRAVPGVVMYAALYMLFYSVTPSKYRFSKCPKWPAALFTTLWWVAITALLPLVLSQLGGYGLTYGSLAGVIVTLLFFYLVGLGIVFGAHLNAALAEPPDTGVESPARTAQPEEAAAA